MSNKKRKLSSILFPVRSDKEGERSILGFISRPSPGPLPKGEGVACKFLAHWRSGFRLASVVSSGPYREGYAQPSGCTFATSRNPHRSVRGLAVHHQLSFA